MVISLSRGENMAGGVKPNWGVPWWWLDRSLPDRSPGERLEALRARGGRHLLLGPPRLEGCRWPQVVEGLHQGPLRALAVQAFSPPLAGGSTAGGMGFAATGTEEGEESLARLGAARELAKLARTPLVVLFPGRLDLGPHWAGDLARHSRDLPELLARVEEVRARQRDRALDRVCRRLHAALELTGLPRLCLRNGFDLAGLDRVEDLAAIQEDLGRARICFWLDPAAAAFREEAGEGSLGALLDRLGSTAAALSLGDGRPGESGQIPGTGLVDFRLVGDYLRRPGGVLPWTVEILPEYGLEGIEAALGEVT